MAFNYTAFREGHPATDEERAAAAARAGDLLREAEDLLLSTLHTRDGLTLTGTRKALLAHTQCGHALRNAAAAEHGYRERAEHAAMMRDWEERRAAHAAA